MSSDQPIVVKPGGSFVYEVTFSPTAEGDHSGQIIFNSNTGESAMIEPDSLAILFGIGKKEPISVDEFTNNGHLSFSITPNPADESIRLTCDKMLGSAVDIEIINITGSTVAVYNKQQFGDGLNINTSPLPNGVYFVKISSNKQTFSRKFTVRH